MENTFTDHTLWQTRRMSEVRSTFRLQPGDPAPDFSLPDATGKLFSRKDVSGPQGLLVVFASNHCPFVVHVADALGTLAREIAAQGIHSVAINPNDIDRYPQDAPQHMIPFAATHGWDFPYLFDASQDVAQAYGAACTPDFFLFDATGALFYAGQFDATRPHRGLAADGGDLRDAARRMLAGEPPPPRPFPSSGCNIKWKPGNQPDWWNAG